MAGCLEGLHMGIPPGRLFRITVEKIKNLDKSLQAYQILGTDFMGHRLVSMFLSFIAFSEQVDEIESGMNSARSNNKRHEEQDPSPIIHNWCQHSLICGSPQVL